MVQLLGKGKSLSRPNLSLLESRVWPSTFIYKLIGSFKDLKFIENGILDISGQKYREKPRCNKGNRNGLNFNLKSINKKKRSFRNFEIEPRRYLIKLLAY